MSRGIIDAIVGRRLGRFPILLIIGLLSKTSTIWSSLRFKSLVRNAKGSNACHWTTEIKYPENISFGNYVAIGPYCCLGAKSPIIIGDYVRISRGAILETAGLNMRSPKPYQHLSKPITISNGVWIGSNAIILGGVTIGADAVIGAGTVVTKDVPAGVVMVGLGNRMFQCATNNAEI
jgi:maltose O-acetyltransferase